jgi:hypothetical protein
MRTLLPLLRTIPNALSAARIGATPVLGYFAVAGAEHYFTWVPPGVRVAGHCNRAGQ